MRPPPGARPLATGKHQVGPGHLVDQLREGDLRRPAEILAGAAGIAEQCLHLGRPEIDRIDPHDHVADLERALRRALVEAGDGADLVHPLPRPCHADAEALGGALHELAHAVLLAGGDDVVARALLLQHQPLCDDIIAGVAPVAPGIEVAEEQAGLRTQHHVRQRPGDLAGDEGLAADRALVVEEDAAAGEEVVRLAVVDRDPVGVELGDAVGRARVEGRRLRLRALGHLAVKLRGRGLVEARLLAEPEDADRLEQAQRADGIGVGGVFRLLERHHDVALGGEVVDLIRLNLLDHPQQARGIGHVAVVEGEGQAAIVRLAEEVIDAIGVEQGGAPLDAVDRIALADQVLRQVRTILAGDARDQCCLGHCSLDPTSPTPPAPAC